MRAMPYTAANFPIGGREAYVGLIWKYSLIALYAALAVLLGATTVGKATDPFFAKLFPAMLFISACAALIGVVLSRWTARVWIEYFGTVALLAGMVGYTIAIFYVAVWVYGDPGRVPGSFIPLIMMVFPIMRLRNILRTVAAFKAAKLLRDNQSQVGGTGDELDRLDGE
jgi:hypothetical protein